jgi:Fe-S-cluster containining protein
VHTLDVLHLTCVRGGGCCHAQHIPVTPWEIALLARALGLSASASRERCTTDGGTRLLADAPAGAHGKPGCRLLGANGCTVHASRPLACRLFPLGRSLAEGRAIYHLADEHPCAAPCPSMSLQPRRRVGEWLQEQDVGHGERAHDAYGRLVCGLLVQAGQLAEASATFAAEAGRLASLDAGRRAAQLPRPWYELATAPGLPELVDDPETFVLAHAERILGAVAAGFAGEQDRAAIVLLTVALQLAEPLGIPPAIAIRHALSRVEAAIA